MLCFPCNLQRFPVSAVHDSSERLQWIPLGAVAPPHRGSHTSYRSASVDETEDWDALKSELAGYGWAYRTPNRVTLASGDPSNSLTVR